MTYGEEKQAKPDLETTLEALRAGANGTLTATVYYGLSGLLPHEIEQFAPVWAAFDVDYKHTVLTELLDSSETNFELEYTAVAHAALDDEDGAVRAAAVELLWHDETLTTMDRLLTLARADSDDSVRAAALSALGRFILLDEWGDLPEGSSSEARQLALYLFADETQSVDVRRRALEAVSNCTLDAVEPAIREAYHSDERLMRVSAVFAMGRTYDERWNTDVLRELKSDDAEMRYEATRAAGELELRGALSLLGTLAFNENEDAEIREIAIWSLGEIGGADAIRVLHKVMDEAEENDNSALLEAAEEALSVATLGGDDFRLGALDDDDDEDYD